MKIWGGGRHPNPAIQPYTIGDIESIKTTPFRTVLIFWGFRIVPPKGERKSLEVDTHGSASCCRGTARQPGHELTGPPWGGTCVSWTVPGRKHCTQSAGKSWNRSLALNLIAKVKPLQNSGRWGA